MNKAEVLSRIVGDGVIGVIRTPFREVASSVIEPIAAGGVSTIEITMTVPGAVDLIKEVSSARSDLLVGAGTVLDPETARRCIDAGARFIVSPSTNFETIRFCKDNDIAVIPGALTPSEIANAWNAGADLVKIYPVDSMGGAGYIRTLKIVFPTIKVIASGGMSAGAVSELVRAGAEAVGSGPDLCDTAAMQEGRPEAVTASAERYLQAVRDGRAAGVHVAGR